MLTGTFLIRCCSVRLTITGLIAIVRIVATLTRLTVAGTLLIAALALLTIATLTGLTVAGTLLIATLTLTILALLTRLIATLTRLVTALAGLTIAGTLLIATLIVVLTWTIATTLGSAALKSCSETFRTEATFIIIILAVVRTLINWALSCMNTRTR
jgi:hypothetical protein